MRRGRRGGAEAGAVAVAGAGAAPRRCGAEAVRTSSSLSSPTISHESPSPSTAHSRAERRSVESKVEKKARPVAVRPGEGRGG